MLAAYPAVLCSPEFISLDEKPGRLDDYAIASRLSFFLWNSPPDDELRELAAKGNLSKPATLRTQPDRLLNDEKSPRFVEPSLDNWLEPPPPVAEPDSLPPRAISASPTLFAPRPIACSTTKTPVGSSKRSSITGSNSAASTAPRPMKASTPIITSTIFSPNPPSKKPAPSS